MKHVCYLAVFLSLTSNVLFAQDHPAEKHIFDKITQLEFTKEGKAMVFTKGGDHLVHVLHQDTFEMEASLVPKGNGPGELQMIKAAYLDHQNGRMYVAGMDKRVLGYSLSGELIFEKTFDEFPIPRPNSKNLSLLIRDGYLFISQILSLNFTDPPTGPIPLVKMLDMNSGELVYELTLTQKQLAFPDPDKLKRANNVPIHPTLTFINKRLSVITIDGLPYFYFFVNGEFVQRTKIETDFQVEFITSKREEFGNAVGVRIPANLNSIQLVDNNKLLIAHGNIHQEIPVGYGIYEIKHTPGKTLLDDISVVKTGGALLEENEDVSAMAITYHKGDFFIHNRFDWLAHQIYVIENALSGR